MRPFYQKDLGDLSLFSTLDYDKHIMRRGPWNRFYSKQSIARIHPLLILPMVNKLCDRLASYKAAHKPVKMVYAYTNFTSDIVTELSLGDGHSDLEKPEFSSQDYEAWMALNKMIHLVKHFDWLFALMNAMPYWVTKLLNQDTNPVVHHQQVARQNAAKLVKMRKDDITNPRPSLMQTILDTDMPESEKTIERITAEAQNAYVAGVFTTTHVLKTATFHLLYNTSVHARLMVELQEHIPDLDVPPTLQQLESMEYLMAIWYESLRTFHGAHRLARIFPDTALPYKQYVIPAGTPVGMSSVFMHTNADIFPDPFAFKPERWLPMDSVGKKLLKYNVALGVGSRGCVGRELGKAEFLATIAKVFRRFGEEMKLMEIEEEGKREVKQQHFLNPLSGERDNGLMVNFHESSGVDGHKS